KVKPGGVFAVAPRCSTTRTPPFFSISSVIRSVSPLAKLGAFHLIRSVSSGVAPAASARRRSTVSSWVGARSRRHSSIVLAPATASELHQHRLRFEVRLETQAALFVADAAFLVAAEGQRRVDHRVAVDPHSTGLELAGDAHGGAGVLGPYARGEAVLSVVGFLDHLVEVFEALRHHPGAEDLLAHHAHLRVHVGEDRRDDVVGSRFRWTIVALQYAGAVTLAGLHVADHALMLLLADQRTHVRVRIERGARRPEIRRRGHAFADFVKDAFVRVEAA